MNVYFIVEGRRTEKKVYPAWLGHLIPELRRVNWAFEADNNNYYLFNGNGFPALLHNHLRNSIDEVNDLPQYSYLVIALDVDEASVEKRIDEIHNFINANDLVLDKAELIIIAQNKTIETWFLGNRRVFKANPQSQDYLNYIKFYNVKENDPEEMGLYPIFNTHAQFHADYCREMLRERNIRYSKTRPNGVVELEYLKELNIIIH